MKTTQFLLCLIILGVGVKGEQQDVEKVVICRELGDCPPATRNSEHWACSVNPKGPVFWSYKWSGEMFDNMPDVPDTECYMILQAKPTSRVGD